MRGALIHGVLLAVMLVYGYRTWTRDKTVKPDYGSIELWTRKEADLVAIEYKGERKTVRLDHRSEGGSSFWWGTETTFEKKVKPAAPKPAEPKPAEPGPGSAAGSGSAAKAAPAAGSGSAAVAAAGSGSAAKAAGSGSAAAGSGSAAVAAAGSGSAAADPAADAPIEETVSKVHQFPLGDAGDKLIASYVSGRALRDLGVATDEMKKQYKLAEPKVTMTVTFRDGTRTFSVGASTFNDTVRYALDQQSNRIYVISKGMFEGLELGEQHLHLNDPRGFEDKKVESVAIEANGKTKTAVRVTTGVEDKQVKTWGDPETKKPNQTLVNFVDAVNQLRPTEYAPDRQLSSLVAVVKLTYRDASGDKLGTLTLYRGEKAGEIPEGTEVDPANPPQSETEYFVVTEKTRVPAEVKKDMAQRIENDVPVVFGDRPPTDGKSIDPKGNPFGTAPPGTPSPHGAAPPSPHGAPPPPPPGGAAPAPPGGIAPAPATPPGGTPARSRIDPQPPGGAKAPGGAAAPAGATPPAPPPAAAPPAGKAPAPPVRTPAPPPAPAPAR